VLTASASYSATQHQHQQLKHQYQRISHSATKGIPLLKQQHQYHTSNKAQSTEAPPKHQHQQQLPATKVSISNSSKYQLLKTSTSTSNSTSEEQHQRLKDRSNQLLKNKGPETPPAPALGSISDWEAPKY
jgi:hypothetical protein